MQYKAIVRMFIIHCSLNFSYKKLRNVSEDYYKFAVLHIHCTLYKLSDWFIKGFIIDSLKMIKPWWYFCKLPKHRNLRKANFEYLW